jgi:hypothetical protein
VGDQFSIVAGCRKRLMEDCCRASLAMFSISGRAASAHHG